MEKLIAKSKKIEKMHRFHAGVEYKDRLYLSGVYVNGLFSCDIHSGRLKYIQLFKEERITRGIHRYAVLYKNEAWFFPEFGENVAVLNLDTMDIIYLKAPYGTCTTYKYYSGGYIDETHYFLVPVGVDILPIIDLENKTIEEITLENKGEELYLFGFYKDGFIHLHPFNGEDELIINVAKKEVSREKTRYGNGKYLGVYYDRESGNICYSPGHEDNLLIVSGENETKISINRGEKFEGLLLSWIIRYKDYLFFTGYESDRIIQLNKKTKYLCEYLMDKREQNDNYYLRFDSERYLIITSESGYIYIYNNDQKDFMQIETSIDNTLLARKLNELQISESEVWGDSEYQEDGKWIDYFIVRNEIRNERDLYKDIDSTIGFLIWNELK